MPQTEVLLIEHMEKLGSEGDIVKVAPVMLEITLYHAKRLYL